MTEILKRLVNTDTAVAIYYKSAGGLCTGFVRAADDEFAMLELISEDGHFDGYQCIRIEEILKMDAGTTYLKNLVKVYRHYADELPPLKVSPKNVLESFTDAIVKNKWLCTMEIGFESLEKISGYPVGRDWNIIQMKLLNEDGKPDGYTAFDLDDIVCFCVRSAYEKYLGVLYILNDGENDPDDGTDGKKKKKDGENKKDPKKDDKGDKTDKHILSFPFGK